MSSAVTCPSCGEENRERAHFCDECGVVLQPSGTPPPSLRRLRAPSLQGLRGYVALLGGGIVVLAAFGFPAAWLQFRNFDIPFQYLSLEHAAKAGLFPTLIFVGLLIYVAAALVAGPLVAEKTEGERDWPLMIALYVVLAPMLLVTLPLYLAAAVVAFVALLLAVLLAVPLIAVVGRVPKFGDGAYRILDSATSWMRDLPGQTYEYANHPERWRFPFGWMAVVAMFVFVFAGLLVLLTVIRLADGDFLGALQVKDIALMAAAAGAAWVLPFTVSSQSLVSKVPRVQRLGMLDLIGVFLLTFFLLAGYYWVDIYPAMPQSLGGGKPEPVVIWVAATDGASTNIESLLSKATCSDIGGLTKCEGLFLIDTPSNNLILTDSAAAPGTSVIVSASDVTAISK